MNYELKQVKKWLQHNNLSLNAGKTELIVSHSKSKDLNFDNVSINFDGIQLTREDYIKYLCMHINECSLWNHHKYELIN